jgi:hypothetical protein
MASALRAGALPRMVALDLDGTLLTSDKRITPRARSAVARMTELGVYVIVCTGRPPRSALGYVAELGLEHPFVCFHGAAMADPTDGALHVRHHLDAVVARRALRRLRAAFPDLMAGLETDHGWFLDPALYDLRTSEARLGPEEPTGVGPIEDFLGSGAVKLFARQAETEAPTLAAAVDDLSVYRTWSSPAMLELLDPHVDKHVALQALCSERGIDRAEVAAFGDQRNDVEMLRWAGLGVAVANADPAAREVADLVALSNDADGVATTLEAWLAAASRGAHEAPTTGR